MHASVFRALAGSLTLAAVAWLSSVGAMGQAAIGSGLEPGLAELRKGQWTPAREQFRRAAESARQAGDRERQAQAVFYLGLVDQAESQGQPLTARDPLLRSALASYEEALRLRPESAGILNNAAQVQVQLGQTNEALGLMARAIATSDPMRSTYTRHYADLLLSAGRWRDACRFYALVAAEQPQNTPLQEKLVGLCLEKGPDLLGLYLWDLAQSGQVVQVCARALEVVDRPIWEPRQADELMAIAAYCLARQNVSAKDFKGSPTAVRLEALKDHRVVGDGARELLRLIEGEDLNPSGYRWWPARMRVAAEAPRGVWPLEAFQQLARSLADRAAEEKDAGRQEKYLLFSVGLYREAPDPEALTQLANVYAESRRLERLDQLMQQYEVDIFRAKGEAYSQSQMRRIYRYHMALGVIYSQLNRWTSPRVVDSANFQLDRAIQVADRLKEDGANQGLAPVVLPAKLVDLLASGYEKTGKKDQAVTLRLDRAEKYLQSGNRPAAIQVLSPLKNSPPPGAANEPNRVRFREIESKLDQPVVPLGGQTGARDIQVSVQAEGIAGNRGRQSLSEADRKAVESAARSALSTLAADSNQPMSKAQSYRTLSNNVPAEIQEITVSGEQGQAVVRRGTNLLKVPFKVDQNSKAPNSVNKARWIRP
ncbi:MAG: hypothetical protein IT581_12835 [Verrucomicrobiales bacterium]|nr:hypothetical protein [Verrucomicrobiales bacterium]